MVFFTCNSCGAALKKPAVEKHGCRPFDLTCMDCSKDFRYDEYKVHNKCISEQEKYTGDKPANKGEKKQDAWVDIVQSTLENGTNLNPQMKSLLLTLTRHDNVPRKKPKFMNFLNNVARNRFDNGTIGNVWELLEARQNEVRELSKPAQVPKEVNGKSDNETESKGSGKKRKLDQNNQDAEITSTSESENKKGRFSWSKEAMDIIKERSSQQIPVKKLQKKLVRKYSQLFPETSVLSDEKIQKKLTRAGFQIENGIVKISV